MKLTVCVVLLVVLALLLPDESAGWWRRRRRRHCSRVNCAWGNWGGWGACTAQCGATGTRTRTRRRDLIVRTPRGTPPVAGSPPGHISYVTDQMNRIKPMPARLLNTAGASRGYIPDGHRRNWDLSLTGAAPTELPPDPAASVPARDSRGPAVTQVSMGYIDECRDGSDTCNSEHGVCTNTEGSYACRCDTGYTGDGRTCIEAGTGWQRVSGGLKFVSVGRSGVWGVNRNDQIYYRTGTYRDEASAGSGWVRIDGALKQISSGDNIVWGVNSNDNIYIRQGICWSSPSGTSWRNIPGKLKQVHVSPTSNQVWGVNSGNNIYRRTGITPSNPAGTGWQNIGGQLKFVSVGQAGVWGVNSNDQIYYRTGTSGNETVPGTGWERVSGALKLISSGNGVVWGVNSNNQIYVRDAGNAGDTVGQCRYGGVYVRVDGTGQCHCPRVCPAIYRPVCGSDGRRYSNECQMRVAACTGQVDIQAVGSPPCRPRPLGRDTRPGLPGTPQGSWYRIEGSLTGVHISSSSNQVWGVNSANNIYRRQGITPVSPKCQG
ncbi:hypothetical protein Bbelb_172000 [Branchiostoma belcheri]|nr:hypothetical protein Bbelb_172000 [Branchiostoma belcheri]